MNDVPMRLVLIIDETPFFYAAHVAVSELTDDGKSHPVMSQDVTHAKAAEDGFEGLLEAVKAILFA